MIAITQDADDLSREHLVQDLDHLLTIGLISAGDGPIHHLGSGPALYRLQVGFERLFHSNLLAYRPEAGADRL